MNAQPSPDARVDQVLTALRNTDPPAGLEQRIAARLAQATQHRTHCTPARFAPSHVSVILNAVKDHCIPSGSGRRYWIATATLVIALTSLTILHTRPVGNMQSQFVPFYSTPASTAPPVQTATATNAHSPHITSPEGHSASATHQVPRGFSLGSHSLQKAGGLLTPASAQDPDQLALAETLAPSRPAPPMPLTAQEQIMVADTRPGQPIQLAELDSARAPIFRAEAEARHNANIQRYVKSLLAPFAVADALQPTKYSEPREISTNASAPPPPISSTN